MSVILVNFVSIAKVGHIRVFRNFIEFKNYVFLNHKALVVKLQSLN